MANMNQHPEYTLEEWQEKYKRWRNRILDFQDGTDPLEVEKYTDIYPGYLHLVTSGKSLQEISEKIFTNHPECGLSSADWGILFSDWLRLKRVETGVEKRLSPSTGADLGASQGLSLAVKAGQTELRSNILKLAKIYKERYDTWDRAPQSERKYVNGEVSHQLEWMANDLGNTDERCW